MQEKLNKAIELRKKGQLKESNDILLLLVKDHPNHAYINYQCAWSFDVLGKENKAVPYYENAIKLGLSDEDLKNAILGLGSTYRTLGDYEKSRSTLMKGMELFQENKAIQVFYSMTLYNLNEHVAAMELLLKCIIETTKDKDILAYKKAIEFYSNKLDEIWD